MTTKLSDLRKINPEMERVSLWGESQVYLDVGVSDLVEALRADAETWRICEPHKEGNALYAPPGEPVICTSAAKYGGECEWVLVLPLGEDV